MEITRKFKVKNGKIIKTETVSEITDYELSVLRKLYENDGVSNNNDEFSAKFNAVIFHFENIGILHEFSQTSEGYVYSLNKNVIEQLLQD